MASWKLLQDTKFTKSDQVLYLILLPNMEQLMNENKYLWVEYHRCVMLDRYRIQTFLPGTTASLLFFVSGSEIEN